MPRQPIKAHAPARDTESVKQLLVRINTEGLRALKILAAEKDTTLVALAIEAFNDLLKKNGRRQVVNNPLQTDE